MREYTNQSELKPIMKQVFTKLYIPLKDKTWEEARYFFKYENTASNNIKISISEMNQPIEN